MPKKSRYHRPYAAQPATQPAVDTRPTAAIRGYDGAWQRVRNWYIRQHPLCQWPGCRQPAAVVDHIQPIAQRPELRLVESNLQSLCHTHHRIKTCADQKIYTQSK